MIQNNFGQLNPAPDRSAAAPAPLLDAPAGSGAPAADPRPAAVSPQPETPFAFPPAPGETPRAFSAFMAFFHLGHTRSLPAVAVRLGEGLPTVKNWSSKFDWGERLQAFNAGLLRSSARDQAERQRRHAADWDQRLHHFREQEWDAAQKLLAAAQCFLESFGEEELARMNLAQVSRALKVSSTIGRLALGGADLSETVAPELAPAQLQLLESLKRVYGQSTLLPRPAGEGSEGEGESTNHIAHL